MFGQNSLNNFYQSLKVTDPKLAVLMVDDILEVATNALLEGKSEGQPAADRLREKSANLPEPHRRVLERALTDLGYS